MNRFWRGFGGRHHWNYGVERTAVPLDVIAKRDNIVVRASMPGIDPKDIQLNIEEGVLTISAETSSEIEAKEESYLLRERRTGSYHRSLRLLDTVDADKWHITGHCPRPSEIAEVAAVDEADRLVGQQAAV